MTKATLVSARQYSDQGGGTDSVIRLGTAEITAGKSEWVLTALGELCDFRAGSVFKRQYQGRNSGDFPFIKVSDMNLSMNRICIRDANNWIDQDIAALIKAKPFPAGTIVFAKIGEALKHNRLRKLLQPTIIDNNMMGAVPRARKVEPLFLYYAMHQFDFGDISAGTALPYLTVAALEELELALPPLPEQRAIAHILGALDEKSELNRQMNETLEEMARGLFKSWFVDFDPVRAKMEGRWRRGQSLPGMPAEFYDLFPDGMVGSELGEIPAGWEVRKVGESFNLTMGQSPPGSTYNDDGEGLPFFQGNADFEFRYPEKRRYCTAPTRIARPDDTLVSVRAPVGAINMAWEECCIGRGVAALRHYSGSTSFTYYSIWALQKEIQQYEHTGTVFGAINKRQFESLLVIEPPAELVECFEDQVKSKDLCIRSNVTSSRTLTDLRDTLLPKLISGEIRVKDVEASLGRES